MVNCAICGGSIGLPGIRVTYKHCKKCGLDFCGKDCAERHLCGYTKSDRVLINTEGYYFCTAMCFGFITLILVFWPWGVGEHFDESTIWWPYPLISLGITLVIVGLGFIERRKKPQRIEKFKLNAPPCPVCRKKTQFNVRYRKYYCKHCGGYL